MAQLAAMASEVTGREVRHTTVTDKEWRNAKIARECRRCTLTCFLIEPCHPGSRRRSCRTSSGRSDLTPVGCADTEPTHPLTLPLPRFEAQA
jgi:hypothetical protein